MNFGASTCAFCIRNGLWIYAGHLLECIAFCFTFVTYYVRLNRSSCWQMLFKIGVFKNLAIFTRKHLCWSFFKLSCRLGGCSWLEWNSLWKFFMLILIKLKLMWYALVCFVGNLICDRKILLLQTVAINLIFLPLNNLDSSYNCISFFPRLK